MQSSSRRVGPTYDTLTVSVQPWPGRTTFVVKRQHFEGSMRQDTRIASGELPLTAKDLQNLTAEGMLLLVLAVMRTQAEPPAPPPGVMGGQLTLDLALRP